jgi:PEP-CTERM motif
MTRTVTMTMLALLSVAALASAETLLVDLSDAAGSTTVSGGNHWNTLPSTDSSLGDLVWTDNTSSGIALDTSMNFSVSQSWGTSGTSPADLDLLAVDSATADGLLFRTANYGAAELTFSGLDAGTAYTFTLFGCGLDNPSLAGPSDFTATGANVVAGQLDTYQNSTDVLVLSDVMPTVGGDIALYMVVPTGLAPPHSSQTYSELNALQLEVVPEPATMSLLAVGGLAALRRRRR